MRLLWALALATGVAHAQLLKIEPVPAQPLPEPGTKGTGALGIDDVWASGIVIAPPAHADAELWPYGMVMTPLDPGDANVLELGSNALPSGPRSAPLGWSTRLSRGIAAGLGGALGLLLPPSL